MSNVSTFASSCGCLYFPLAVVLHEEGTFHLKLATKLLNIFANSPMLDTNVISPFLTYTQAHTHTHTHTLAMCSFLLPHSLLLNQRVEKEGESL